MLPTTSSYISILSQNIRSIGANLSGLLTLMERIEASCDIVVLSECWLSRYPTTPVINGYDSYKTRYYNQNDGVIVYVKKSLTKVKVNEPDVLDCNCLIITVGSDLAIIALYRPYAFSDPSNFIQSMDRTLSDLKSYRNIVLVGDINIDIASGCRTSHSLDYLDLLSHHGLFPGHVIPTHGHTCYDHMNLKTTMLAKVLVLETTLTDHFAVLLAISRNSSKNKNLSLVTKTDEEQLQTDLTNIDFGPIYNTDDPNLATSLFIDPIISAIKNNTKLISLSRRRRPLKAWITPGLLRCMRHRDRLYKLSKKEPSNEVLLISYKRYRNFCTNILRQAKQSYERAEFSKAGKNSKQLWNVIQSVTNLAKSKSSANDLLDPNRSHSQTINEVNSYFIRIGRQLADNVHPGPTSNLSSNVVSHLNSFAVIETDVTEIRRLILSLKNNCAVGCDDISSGFLKKHIDLFAPPLTYICNLSLSTGIFPDLFKKALVHPIFKSGDRSLVENYRPISVLPALSKILEKIINSRLVSYLETNNLLSPNQFGFRKKKSTADAVHSLVDYIATKLDQTQKCVGLFLDLTKAFDTVSIPILLSKLEALGVRGTQLSLFRSYLSGRTQRVKIGHISSSELLITHGVPQGSILGPSLFLIYINDMCNLSLQNGTIFSYADDAALIFSAGTWSEAYQFAQRGFDAVGAWLKQNLLTLNLTKTKLLNFSIRNSLSTNPITLRISTKPSSDDITPPDGPAEFLDVATSITYLGVIIDCNLNFKLHIDQLSNRVRKLIFIFKLLRQSADADIMKMVYGALCQSILNYCITTWGGAAKTHLIQVERAQRAVLKVCCFKPRLYPTDKLYEFCEVPTVRQLFILQSVLKQHSLTQFQGVSNRRNPLIKAVHTKTAFGHRFFLFLGPFLYKKLNKILSLYHLNRYRLKITVLKWLLKQSYAKSENLLLVPS